MYLATGLSTDQGDRTSFPALCGLRLEDGDRSAFTGVAAGVLTGVLARGAPLMGVGTLNIVFLGPVGVIGEFQALTGMFEGVRTRRGVHPGSMLSLLLTIGLAGALPHLFLATESWRMQRLTAGVTQATFDTGPSMQKDVWHAISTP